MQCPHIYAQQNGAADAINRELSGLQGLQSCEQQKGSTDVMKEVGGLQGLRSCKQQNDAADAINRELGGLQGFRSCEQQNGEGDDDEIKLNYFRLGQLNLPALPAQCHQQGAR